MYKKENYKSLCKLVMPVKFDLDGIRIENITRLTEVFKTEFERYLKSNHDETVITTEMKLRILEEIINKLVFGNSVETVPIDNTFYFENKSIIDKIDDVFTGIIDKTHHNNLLTNESMSLKIYVTELIHVNYHFDYLTSKYKNIFFNILMEEAADGFMFVTDTIDYVFYQLAYLMFVSHSIEESRSQIDSIFINHRSEDINYCFGLALQLVNLYRDVYKKKRRSKREFYSTIKGKLIKCLEEYEYECKEISNSYYTFEEDEVYKIFMEKQESILYERIGEVTQQGHIINAGLIHGDDYPDEFLAQLSEAILVDNLDSQIVFKHNYFNELLDEMRIIVNDLTSTELKITRDKLNNIRYGKSQKVKNKEYIHLSKELGVKPSDLFELRNANQLKTKLLKDWYDGAVRNTELYNRKRIYNPYLDQPISVRNIIMSERLYGPDGEILDDDVKEMLVNILNSSIELLDHSLGEKEGVYQICEFVKNLRKKYWKL